MLLELEKYTHTFNSALYSNQWALQRRKTRITKCAISATKTDTFANPLRPQTGVPKIRGRLEVTVLHTQIDVAHSDQKSGNTAICVASTPGLILCSEPQNESKHGCFFLTFGLATWIWNVFGIYI